MGLGEDGRAHLLTYRPSQEGNTMEEELEVW